MKTKETKDFLNTIKKSNTDLIDANIPLIYYETNNEGFLILDHLAPLRAVSQIKVLPNFKSLFHDYLVDDHFDINFNAKGISQIMGTEVKLFTYFMYNH